MWLLAGGLLITILLVLIIIHICRIEKLKKGGIIIQGHKVNYHEIIGRPNIHRITVKYHINGKTFTKRITTTDSRARRFEKEQDIQLLYVERLDKVFWVDESEKSKTLLLVVLGIMAFGALWITTAGMINSCVDKQKNESGYRSIDVTYIGSAKIDDPSFLAGSANGLISTFIDEGREYSYVGYVWIFGEEAYERYASDDRFGLHDEDFEKSFSEGKGYILVYGRKLVSFEYNPDILTHFGRIPNRVALEWEEEPEKDTAYLYEFEDNIEHPLADMSVEFVEDEYFEQTFMR